MAGINKVILIGNLGRDPEVRYTPDGTAVANFLDCDVTGMERQKQRRERKSATEWHRIVAWRKLGELCGEYLSKGRQVYVEGRLQTRDWQDKDGNKRYTTEVVANEVQFLGPKESAKSRDDYGGPPPPDAEPPYSDSQDDDIPF